MVRAWHRWGPGDRYRTLYAALVESAAVHAMRSQRPACMDPSADPELWYADDARSERRAKALCMSCCIQVECARYAIASDEEGIWGGLTQKERRAVARSV